ncbi:thiamine pyrophosphate-requiring protein [Sulfuracidifex tepidarius]|uniref:2-oxoacid oxidoreductase (ferredoxin) n=1 Tax=Sulfuracidifex tepidarius TaxID=1294262 RepID=A0A510E0N9_9CREN|nr:thiamine pyrophosphate-requiring protein [Sulfuracidifex tepidarius]BBG26046.1 3D-(3,5/4)-trihydroxycyclohexane-1,2-dione hydrolase [Sulfuracidifex tepidarius]
MLGAGVVLKGLKEMGVDRLFIVSGTDYPGFIEEKVRMKEGAPDFVVVPHEITAASAAMGYSMAGKLGVVAVHTTPGTANALGIIANAFYARQPLLVVAGRSPYTEEGHPASRSLRSQWAQEFTDQGGLVRQVVKWDFEVRRAEQIAGALARAVHLSESEPRGPVYLVFPREVTVEEGKWRKVNMSPYEPGPREEDLRKAAKMIEESENPVIVTWRAGRRKEWFDSMKYFADTVGVPVVNYVGETVNYAGDMGLDQFDLSSADLVIAVETEVPWPPKKVKVGGKVIKVDVDPGYSRISFYDFPCDLCVMSNPKDFFDRVTPLVSRKEEWRAKVMEMRREQERKKEERAKALAKEKKVKPDLLSWYVGRMGLTVFNEYPFNFHFGNFSWGQYFGDITFGHLGWTMGASFGYSLATGKATVATVGDGSFIFGVPEAFYYAVRTYETDCKVVIYDNGGWLASEEALDDVFQESVAKERGEFPGAEMRRYNSGEGVKAYGGYYKLVESPWELEEAFSELKGSRLGVLQVVTEKRDPEDEIY